MYLCDSILSAYLRDCNGAHFIAFCIGVIEQPAYTTEGSTTVLQCHTSSVHGVSWRYRDRSAEKDSMISFNHSLVTRNSRCKLRSSTPGEFDLVILDTRRSDAGIYACKKIGSNPDQVLIRLYVNGLSTCCYRCMDYPLVNSQRITANRGRLIRRSLREIAWDQAGFWQSDGSD